MFKTAVVSFFTVGLLSAFANGLVINPADTSSFATTNEAADMSTKTNWVNAVPDGTLNMRSNALDDVTFLEFDTAYTNGTSEGRLQWNSDDGTLEVGMPGGSVNLQIGQEHLIRVRNTTGSTISNGQAVAIIGASGNRPLIALADADASAPTNILAGVVTENIANNANGYMTSEGLVRDLDTSAYTEGDMLYLSTTAGAFTNVEPSHPTDAIEIGTVVSAHASQGIILVSHHATKTWAELDAQYTTAASSDNMATKTNWANATPDGNLSMNGQDLTNATLIHAASRIGVRVAAPTALVQATGDLASDWAGRFENSNANGLGILGITAGSDAADIAFEARVNTSTKAMSVRGDGNTSLHGNDLTNAATITATTSIGVGTNAPAEDINIFSSAPVLRVQQSTTDDYLDVGDYGLKLYGDDMLISAESATRDIQFKAGGSERMRIDGAAGNVGIGTNAPAALLDVNGASTIRGDINLDGNSLTNVAGMGFTGGILNINSGIISNSGAPTANSHLATKAYVDGQVASAGATNFVFAELYRDNVTNAITFADTNTWHILTGWQNGDSVGVTVSGSNTTIAAGGTYEIIAMLSGITGPSNKDIEFGIFKNGSVKADGRGKRYFSSGDIGMGGLSLIEPLSVADTVSLRCRMASSPATGTLTLRWGQLSVKRLTSVTQGTNWSQYAALNDINAGGNMISNVIYSSSTVPSQIVPANGTATVTRAMGDICYLVATNNTTLAVEAGGWPSNHIGTFSVDINPASFTMTLPTGTFYWATAPVFEANSNRPTFFRKGYNQTRWEVK